MLTNFGGTPPNRDHAWIMSSCALKCHFANVCKGLNASICINADSDIQPFVSFASVRTITLQWDAHNRVTPASAGPKSLGHRTEEGRTAPT